MTSRLSGRVAWVTGGGRGIGRSIALAMAAEGAAVAVSSRSETELEAVADEIRALGSNALAVRADAMSLDDTLAAAARIESELGGVDILVNNAGGGVPPRTDSGLSREQIDAFAFADNVDLNLFSAYRATRSVLRGMRERRYGRIINIGSGYAKRSGGALPYTAAKHGLVGLTKAMAGEVAGDGISVNCLCPGWTNTQLVDLDAMAAMRGTSVAEERARIASENLQNRVLEPDELGPMAVLLASEDASSITGQVISVDGGYKV
ncbi:MAG: SDR family NAD(P)-dependent oxidoreductase [Gammaproteobacteria bacterium]|nr:MAG: SDR family NAD(P)-dependent oxidoreductase [Gammaproteobacteria bacterium]